MCFAHFDNRIIYCKSYPRKSFLSIQHSIVRTCVPYEANLGEGVGSWGEQSLEYGELLYNTTIYYTAI